MRFFVNGKRHDVDAPPLKRLVDVLREHGVHAAERLREAVDREHGGGRGGSHCGLRSSRLSVPPISPRMCRAIAPPRMPRAIVALAAAPRMWTASSRSSTPSPRRGRRCKPSSS